jgi:adenylate cyclase
VKTLSEPELAQLAGVSLGRLEQLGRLRILSRQQGGSFRPSDVQIVRIVEALEEAGITAEQISELIRVGEFSFRLTEVAFPEPPTFSSKTLEEVAADLAIPVELVQRRYAASGLPRPAASDPVRNDDLEGLQMVAIIYNALGGNEAATVEPNRHLGENLRRIAESQVRFFKSYLEQPMLDSGMPLGQVLDTISEYSATFIPASIHGVNWLYKRHLEHFIMQEIIELTEAALEKCEMVPRRAANPPAIAFLDLTSYTSLTEERGDEAAADLATRLSDVVRDASQARGGYPVKFLGDGVMFYFPNPAGAVLCGLELVDQVPRLELPPARMGVAAGPVVFRDGDYFGRTVNTAARISDYARPGEVLVSEDVAALAMPEGVSYVAVGPVSLKGLTHSITLHLAMRGN